MCGIAGLLDSSRATGPDALHERARDMASTLRHRGPDDAGIGRRKRRGLHWHTVVSRSSAGARKGVSPWCRGAGAGFSATTASSTTPTPCGTASTRPEYRFRGTSDTEVLVAASSTGASRGTLERVEGMFAFAAWDGQDRCLHLVRDRFGEKPLYYGWAGGRFVFASELKAIRAYPGFAPAVDPSAVLDFLRGSCVPAPACIYEGLAKLRPGALLTIGSGARPGQLPIQKSFWSADHAIDAACALPPLGDDQEAMYELERALSRSVGAGWSPTSRWARSCRGASTRA